MLNLAHVDLVVVLMCSNPLDPHDRLFEIDRHDQSVVVSLDVENNSFRRNDARRCIASLHVRRAAPSRLFNLVEPGIQRGLQSWLVSISSSALNELSQGAPGDDPHTETVSRAPNGRKCGALCTSDPGTREIASRH